MQSWSNHDCVLYCVYKASLFPLTWSCLVAGSFWFHFLSLLCSFSVWFEPTCLDKASKPIRAGVIDTLTYISPNMAELLEMNLVLTGSETSVPELGKNDLMLATERVCIKFCSFSIA